jgi:nicotinamidase/pyrazinamidase
MPRGQYGTVLFDIDTQNDFLLPVGGLSVPGAAKLIPSFERIYQLAHRHNIPVVATADAHTERDPEFSTWPPHCVAGTLGQAKVPGTLMAGALTIPNRARPTLSDAQQLIVEKQTVDVFQPVTMADVLAARPAKRYVVFGVVTEICVWYAVLGLLERGKAVEVITDAIASLDPAGKGRAALDEMAARGARRVTLADLEASLQHA